MKWKGLRNLAFSAGIIGAIWCGGYVHGDWKQREREEAREARWVHVKADARRCMDRGQFKDHWPYGSFDDLDRPEIVSAAAQCLFWASQQHPYIP